MKNLANVAILLLVVLVSGCSSCDETVLLKTCPIGSQDELPCVVTTDGKILVDDRITSQYSNRGMCNFGHTTCIDVTDESGKLVDKVMGCQDYVPSAQEICDGFDNDCNCPGDTNEDGVTCGCSFGHWVESGGSQYWEPGIGCDEGVDEHFDLDADGHSTCGWDGIPGNLDDDCLDNDPLINPTAQEICDGIDNNCNCLNLAGNFRDSNGDGLSCSCSPTSFGSFTTIDSDGITHPACIGDDCCDEGIDELLPHSFACFEDRYGNSYDPLQHSDASGILYGICSVGKKQCENGTYTPCDAVLPSEEVCDGFDNDCDGEVDDGSLIEVGGCYDGPAGTENVGICHPGNKVCVAPELYCWEQQLPDLESCDGLDNDCDGIIDNNIDDTICDLGCGPGPSTCDIGGAGDWICMADPPTPEICDGLDNDCDGIIDEEIADFNNDGVIDEDDVCPCQLGDTIPCAEDPMFYFPANPGDQPVQMNPACGNGIRQCLDADNDGITEWSVCFFLGTDAEVCDGWDNDCVCGVDSVDLDPDPNIELCEVLNVPCYSGPPNTAGVGECVEGYRECSGQGFNGPCIGEVLPGEESCDGLDNDCDGEIDEDLNPHEKVDMLFLIDASGSMGTVGQVDTPIDTLFNAISQYVGTFQQTTCPPSGNPNGPQEECHRFAVAVFPGTMNCGGNNPTYNIMNPNNGQIFKPIIPFLNDMGMIQGVCGSEPSLDAAYASMSPQPPGANVNLNMALNWRPDAYPYIVLLTDEPAQSWHGTIIQDVSSRMSNCTVGCCIAHPDCEEQPMGLYEFYVVTNIGNQAPWQPIPADNIKDFSSFNPHLGGSIASGVSTLQDIFQDICIPGP